MKEKKQYCTPRSTVIDIDEEVCMLPASNPSSAAEGTSPGFGYFDED